jgi:hypothetical protein
MGNADPADDEPAETVLARLVERGARLLRVERGQGPPASPPRLRLVFEVGAVVLEPDAAGEALRAREEPQPGAGGDAVVADEDDPWWTLLGHPLTRVATRDEGALLVQFRPDDASPKILVLAPGPGAVRVRTVV